MNRRFIGLLLQFGVAAEFLIVTVFAVSTSNAQGPDPLPTCALSVHPIDCYTASTDIAVMYCELETRTAVARVNLGGSYTDMLSTTRSCTKRFREKVDPRYDAAAQHLAANRDGLNLLKDYHAFWHGTMDSLDPSPNETENAYKRRLADRQTVLRDKRNRLLLEK